MSSVTHVAGMDMTWAGRYLRQRCAWCDAILVDVDLHAVSVPAGQDPTYPTWPVGALITINGPVSTDVSPDPTLLVTPPVPDDSCMRNDPRERTAPCDWDGESHCMEDDCHQRATHRRFLGAIGEDEIVELVCCEHAVTEWAEAIPEP